MTKLEETLIEIGYERHTDTYNFGKVKGNSINTNVVIQDINIQRDLEELRKYES